MSTGFSHFEHDLVELGYAAQKLIWHADSYWLNAECGEEFPTRVHDELIRVVGSSNSWRVFYVTFTRSSLVLLGYLDRAEAHLQAGWAYTNALPRRSVRVRLACAWPILIGRETLKLLRAGDALDPQQRIKVSRTSTAAYAPLDSALPLPGSIRQSWFRQSKLLRTPALLP